MNRLIRFTNGGHLTLTAWHKLDILLSHLEYECLL